MHHVKGVLVLLAATAFVGLVVVGLSQALVGETPDASLVAAPPAGGATTDTTLAGPTLDEAPDTRAMVVRFSGDRVGVMLATDGYDGFLHGIDGRVTLGYDPDTGVFIDQMAWDGLDFFLDPGDCEFAEDERLPDEGMIEVSIDCGNQTDVRDTASVSITGEAHLSIIEWDPDVPDLLAGIEITGDHALAAELFTSAWVTSTPDLPFEDEAPSFFSLEEGDTVDINLGVDGVRMWMDFLAFTDGTAEGFLELPEDRCPVDYELVQLVGPQTELMSFALACQDLEVADVGTISVDGSGYFLRVPQRASSNFTN